MNELIIMKLLKLVLFLFIFLISVSVIGQSLLRGKVTNNNGEAVVNTLVFLDSVKSDVVTDQHGYFRILVPKDVKKITLYSPKYGFLSTAYSGEQKISFKYIERVDSKEANQAEIGYGKEDKDKLSSTVNVLNVKDDNNALMFTDIYDYIRGRVAGVEVSSSNKILIRGVGTLSSSTEPLLVVDGVIVNDIDFISPIEVRKISVLKGSSASIYGSNGANGVIEITTKHQ